jgi:hypothetical protein
MPGPLVAVAAIPSCVVATWIAVGRGWLEPYAPILDFLGDTLSPVWATIAKPFTARQPAATVGGCAHPAPEAVHTVGGDLVAWLCPDCGRELPADWR